MKSRHHLVRIFSLLALFAASPADAEPVGPFGGWINDLEEEWARRRVFAL